MPRKQYSKKANVVKTLDWKNKKYDGYLDDVYALVQWCSESDLENEIDGILDELHTFHDNMPDRNQAQHMARSHYGMMIVQLEKIKNYVHILVDRLSSPPSLLLDLMEQKPFIGNKDLESSYGLWNDMLDELIFEDGNKLFRDKQGTGSLFNIKANLDQYNIINDYEQFTSGDSVLIKVDNIFNKSLRLYSELTRIQCLKKKYDAENVLEDNLGYKKKNLEEYGKRCLDNPEFNLSDSNNAYIDARRAFFKAEDSLNSDIEAETEADEAFKKAEELKVMHERISELYSNLNACDVEYKKIESEPCPEDADQNEYEAAKKEKLSSILGQKVQLRRKLKELVKGTDIPADDEAAFHRIMDPRIADYEKLRDDLASKREKREQTQKLYDECKSKKDTIALSNATSDIFYQRYINAMEFDKYGSQKKVAKEMIYGTRVIQEYKDAFRDYYGRKYHVREEDHTDTPEFTGMTEGIASIVNFDAKNSSIDEYVNLLGILKTAAQHYLEKKASQRFHWIPSKMRKYRLQFAKSIITLCDSQLDAIDTEDFKHTTEIAASYINKEPDLYDDEMIQLSKEEYYKKLDESRQEAIDAYASSVEYKIEDDRISKEYNEKMASQEVLLDGFKDNEFMIEQIKKRKEELTQEYNKNKEQRKKKIEIAKNGPVKNTVPKELRHRRMNAFVEDPMAGAEPVIQQQKKQILDPAN